MTLLWIDGFDNYGGDGINVSAKMRSAGYFMGMPFSSDPQPVTSSFTQRGFGHSLLPNTFGQLGGPLRVIPSTVHAFVGLRVCVPRRISAWGRSPAPRS